MCGLPETNGRTSKIGGGGVGDELLLWVFGNLFRGQLLLFQNFGSQLPISIIYKKDEVGHAGMGYQAHKIGN